MKNIILILTISILFGCTSVKITSEKASDYSGQLDNVLLITEFSPSMSRFQTALNEEITTYFENASIEYRVEELTLSEDDTTSLDLSSFCSDNECDEILIITQRDRGVGGGLFASIGTNGSGFGFGGISKKYELTSVVFDVENSSEVWNAEIKTEGDEYTGQKKEARDTAKKLFSNLIEEKMVSRSVFASSNQ